MPVKFSLKTLKKTPGFLYFRGIQKKTRDMKWVKEYAINPYKTAQRVKFSIKDFFSKCDQIRSFLRIWSHLLKKSLMENFIFMQLWDKNTQVKTKWVHKKQDMRCIARTSSSKKVTNEQHLVIKNSYIIRYLVPTKTFLLK